MKQIRNTRINAFEWETNGKSLKSANCIKGIYAGCSQTKVKLNSHTMQKSRVADRQKGKTPIKSRRKAQQREGNNNNNENLQRN